MDDIKQYPVEARNEYHVACVLLLDTSSSMADEPIDRLNQGLVKFKQDTLNELPGAKSKVIDIAIVEFNSSVNVIQNFAPIDKMEPPTLQAKGLTHMGEGMKKALELIDQRKQHYKDPNNSTPYHRPWIFMITDGGPNDDYQSVFQELQQLEDNKSVVTWAIGVEGYNEELLKQIMPWYTATIDGVPQKRQRLFRLEGLNFAKLFEFLSDSMIGLSRSVPDQYGGEDLPSCMEQVNKPYGAL